MRAMKTNLMYGVLAIVIVVAFVTPSSDPLTLLIYSLPLVAAYLAGACTPKRRAS